MSIEKISENFSLKDVYKLSHLNLEDRADAFYKIYFKTQEKGEVLYRRQIVSAPGREVEVLDPNTNNTKKMIMFGSNSYLDFGNHPYIKKRVEEILNEYGTGYGGPPLLNGSSKIHRKLELMLAKMKGTEDCLLYSSGYQANLGWATGLIQKNDELIYDSLSHASLLDAIKMLRSDNIKCSSFKHYDLSTLVEKLEDCKKRNVKQVFVSTEGVFSMDGHLPPLKEICEICKKYGAFLILDDAHGTGVMGKNGTGTIEHFSITDPVPLIMGTFSKSFSTTGGFLCGSKEVIHFLRFFSRPYIFSAHMPPTVLGTVIAGLELMEKEPGIFDRLRSNVQKIEEGLNKIGYKVNHALSPIIPILFPEHINIRNVCKEIHDAGIFLNSIEYPAVPLHLQRIRISVMASHTDEDISKLLTVLDHVYKKYFA